MDKVLASFTWRHISLEILGMQRPSAIFRRSPLFVSDLLSFEICHLQLCDLLCIFQFYDSILSQKKKKLAALTLWCVLQMHNASLDLCLSWKLNFSLPWPSMRIQLLKMCEHRHTQGCSVDTCLLPQSFQPLCPFISVNVVAQKVLTCDKWPQAHRSVMLPH